MKLPYGGRPSRAGDGQSFARRIRDAYATSTSAKRDSVALLVIGALIMVVEYFTDLASAVFQFAIDNQDWEIDNAIFVIFVMSVGLLVFCFRRGVELQGEVTARRSAERTASELARHDPLTGLPNRRYFIEMLGDTLSTTTPVSPSAVLMLDLDGFKLINDAYGHAVGDQFLIAFARRISGILPAGATLIRFGGDEFAIVLPNVGSLDAAAAQARQIVATVAEPFEVDQISGVLGVGIGIALAPSDGADPELLVQRADRALYRAKAEGRSHIRFFEPEMDAHIDRRIAMETKLRAAIAAKIITPHYQPIVSLKTERVVGFEALARWRGEEGEWIAPDLFIPMAEELGVIDELGDHLLRRACCDARHWPRELTLAFNLSAKQLGDPTVGLRILAILADTHFSPRRLEIEITETAVVANIEIAQRVTRQLREAGVRIALDDFGTGYSTFGQLLSLKLDRIKIDRSFVDRLSEDKDRATIVRAVLGLASGFELATTAEGVENREQLASLNADGCLEGQGYLFGRAVPADEVLSLLARADPRSTSAA